MLLPMRSLIDEDEAAVVRLNKLQCDRLHGSSAEW
jgi:hypothetical protein